MAAEEREFARAKVNLFLHIPRRREDGYHEVESLAVFPRIGDLIEARTAESVSLEIEGPFAEGLSAGPDNLIVKAAEVLGPGQGAALRLVKNLPVASGIGGGSADGAAALRLFARLRNIPAREAEALAPRLGADALVCYHQRPAIMTGIGEKLTPAPAFPGFAMVLVNPRQPLSTAEVFGALVPEPREATQIPAGFDDFERFTTWLASLRNDLEAPALRLRPVIAEALTALEAAPGCHLARMSGSGATCFGLFRTETEAAAAARVIRERSPEWWVETAPVEPWAGQE